MEGGIVLKYLILIFMFVLIGCTDPRLYSYKDHCAQKGGHIYQPTENSPNYCLTDDGRMIEVYP